MNRCMLVFASLALWLVAATSAAQKGERFPEFDGTVIPIELPFAAEYRPYRSVESVRMDIKMKIGNDAADMKAATVLEQAVQNRAGKLEWTADIREMTMFGKKLRSRSPLMTARWISGPSGDAEGFEVAYPGLVEQGLTDMPPTPQKGTMEYEAILRQFGGARRLPAEPIVTGATIFEQPLRDILGEMQGVPVAVLEQRVGYSVKGWGFYKDKKVLVATQAYDAPFSLDGGESVTATLAGYSLFDANTFARVKSDFLMIFSGRAEGKPLYIRVRGTSESKLN